MLTGSSKLAVLFVFCYISYSKSSYFSTEELFLRTTNFSPTPPPYPSSHFLHRRHRHRYYSIHSKLLLFTAMDHDPPKSPSKRTAGGHGRFGTIFASVQATVSAVATSFSPSQNRKSNSADASDPTDAADAANATDAADAANATDAADAADAIPQFSCDWASESCTLKNLKPSLCQYDGCDAPVHHLCQNLWQDSHGFVEESCSWYCRRHNKFYNQSMLGNANGDAVDFTGGDGLQLLSDNELESGMPPLPDINNNHSNLLLTDLDDNDKRKMTIGKPSKKARAPPTLTTTARKGKKRQAKCVVGARVSMTRKLLKTHLDYDSDAFKSIEGLSDELILYGTVVGS